MEKKMKPDYSIWISVLIGLSVSVLFYPVLKQLFHERLIQFIPGVGLSLLALYTLFHLMLTGNRNFLVVAGMLWFFALSVFLYNSKVPWLSYITFLTGVILLVWSVILICNREFKWRYRELMELAARPVKGTTDGYTTRALEIGHIGYREDQVSNFARFLVRHMIAIPREEPNQMVFLVSRKIRYFWKSDYSSCSRVRFHSDGAVSVQFSKKDYAKYKNNFTFDRLCVNLGRNFVKMFDWYQKGDEERIINWLNEGNANIVP